MSAYAIALLFIPKTCRYSAHACNCSAYTGSTRRQVALPGTYETVEAARAFADADESDKAGKPTKAIFRVCKCVAKAVRS